MGLIDNVNVQVTGNGDLLSTLQTYVTKVLKPNIVDGKNTLTQEMVSAKNTKYVIKYDYELAENITIPENCILEFDGGSILGEHTITGQNTGIQAELVKIFNTDITLAGTWNVVEAYPEWFGASTTNADNTSYFQAILDNCDVLQAPIKIQKGVYNFEHTIIIKHSNTRIVGSGIRDSRLFNTSLIEPFIVTAAYSNNEDIVTYVEIKDINLTFNASAQRSIEPFYFYNTSNLSINSVCFSAYNNREDISTYKNIVNKAVSSFGGQFCTQIHNSLFHFCSLKLEGTTDSIISNSIFWSVTCEYALDLSNSNNSIIEGNEIVGGNVYGGIYCANGKELNNLKILGNYFDGNTEARYDTRNAICCLGRMWFCTITGNNFWYYKGGAIKIRIGMSTIISSNVFCNNDRFGRKEPDIDMYEPSSSVIVTGNSFTRYDVFVKDESTGTWSVVERTGDNKSLYAAPIIRLLNLSTYKPSLVMQNVRQDYNSYLAAEYPNKMVVAKDNYDNFIENNSIFGDMPTSGIYDRKPTSANYSIPVGYKYFCIDRQTAEGATNGIEIFYKGNDTWVDALGRTVS